MNRNAKRNGLAITATVMIIGMAFLAIPDTACAQGTGPLPQGFKPRLPMGPTAPKAKVSSTVIRGITYQDHSAGTSATPRSVAVNGSFTITSSTLNFNTPGTLKVVLQDTARPSNGYGVTVFELRGVRRVGNSLVVQGPAYPIFRNRTFHVSVFLYTGSANLYANAGTVTFK